MAEDFDAAINKLIGRVALRVVRELKETVPTETGRLKNSIVAVKDGGKWVVGTNVEYAEYVEFGTEPHEIKPKNKKALYWKGAPYPVKKVQHPGTTGQFVFQKASLKAPKFLKEELKKL